MAWSVDSTGLEADHTHEYDVVDTPQQNSGRQLSWAASTGVRLSPVGVSSASHLVFNGSHAALPEMHPEGSQLSLAISPCFRHPHENEAPWKQFRAPSYGNIGSPPSAHHANQNEAAFATMNNSIQRDPLFYDSTLRVPSNSTNTATNHPWNTPDIRLTQKNDQPHGADLQGDTSVPEPFWCRWRGCQYKGSFRRESSLVRHLRKIHIAPQAHPCQMANCEKVFNRADNLEQHKRNIHRLN